MTVRAIERDEFTTVFQETADEGKVDHILIDLAGTREATVLKAIVPLRSRCDSGSASEPDLKEALVVVSDVKDVAKEKGATDSYRVLLTKMPPLRTRVTDFAYKELSRHGLPIFPTAMGRRTAYREMFFTGKPGGQTHAGAEVAALASEMEDIVKASKIQPAPLARQSRGL